VRSAFEVGQRAARAGFHVVEVIAKTAEVILAAQHGSNVVAVHAKLTGGTAAVTVRSADAALAQAACAFLAAALQAE
jgi:hypothetical protein